MLSDERFSSKAKVDRYGRRLPKDQGQELKRLYKVEDEVEDNLTAIEQDDGLEHGLVSGEDDDQVRKELRRVSGKDYDPARDGGFEGSSSSDETSSDESDDEVADEEEERDFPDQQADGIPAGEVTSRLAIVNLDWDNIRASDLLAVFSSFLPSSGRILKVEVYPSEFGKERMQREEMEGPPKEIFASRSKPDEATATVSAELSSDDESIEEIRDAEDPEEENEQIKKALLQEDKGAEFDPSHLRRYQLERLRYFYAVLTCSSPGVAEALYNAIDGTEYLTTANFFDLRFIPDDMEFEDDKPRDECDRIPDGYRPNEFVTDALQHSKVRLTWDADDVVRKEVQKRAFKGSRADIDANDLKAYLGSDSSDDEEMPVPVVVDSTNTVSADGAREAAKEDAQPKLSKKDTERQRMRALLGLTSEHAPRKSKKDASAPVGDMQITFSAGLSVPKGTSVFENQPEPEETIAEKYIRKEKERKARRKEKMKAARNGEEVPSTKAPIKDEGEPGSTAEDQDLGFEDPFFTAPEEDKAASIAARKEAKALKRSERAAADAASSAQRAELELLMVDEDQDRATMQHFDINAITKAEKALKKKKGRKVTARIKDALEAKEKDAFQMNVADPRFGAVFERAEFAVDPSHPKFKGTEGMKALLEEGRKKRSRMVLDGDEGRELGDERRKVRKRGDEGEHQDGRGLQELLQRVKGTAKQSESL